MCIRDRKRDLRAHMVLRHHSAMRLTTERALAMDQAVMVLATALLTLRGVVAEAVAEADLVGEGAAVRSAGMVSAAQWAASAP